MLIDVVRALADVGCIGGIKPNREEEADGVCSRSLG